MRHPIPIACLGLALAACSPPSAPVAPAAPPAPDAGGAVAEPVAGLCTASPARKAPMHFWKQVGSLVVAVQGQEPVSVEVRDSSGRSLETAKVSNKKEMRSLAAKMTCRVGGVLYLAPAGKPVDGMLEMKVLAAASQDPTRDLQNLCGVPEMPQGFDPSQQRRVAVEIYEESLGSTRWREWLFTLTGKLQTATEQDGATLRKKAGEELAAAAKQAGIQECWFATSLVSP